MTVIILPTYQGFSVDARLKEFRKAVYGQTLQFKPFDSPEGRKLLDAMAKDAPNLFQRVYSLGN